MVVLDTSVIIKWFIDDEDTPLALEFQRAHICVTLSYHHKITIYDAVYVALA